MNWGKEWHSSPIFPEQLIAAAKADEKEIIDLYGTEPNPVAIGVDLGSKPSQTVTAIIKDGQIEKVYNNLSPTHDPYTNSNSHIYYQCKCGMILDPGTKSFAALNNCASEKGWKVRWGKDGQGYEPFCVECGEGVE